MALLVRLVFTSHMVPSVLPTSSEPLQQQMLTDTEKNNDINISLRPPLRFLAPPRQNALQIYNNILQSYVCIKLLCGGFDRHSYIYIYIRMYNSDFDHGTCQVKNHIAKGSTAAWYAGRLPTAEPTVIRM